LQKNLEDYRIFPRGTMEETFSQRIRTLITNIPSGRVATYGRIAAYAGNPRGARQVVRILHSSSEKYNLPWHRVINSKGRISLPRGNGYEVQKELLLKEGIVFNEKDEVDLSVYVWEP
jgi:methylated-DNA-protein-cysteine methyltransferase related protein